MTIHRNRSKSITSGTLYAPQVYDRYIGIDPDVDRSGVAFLERKSRRLELTSLAFPDLMDYFQFAKRTTDEKGDSVIVIVEASWLVSHNWHASAGQSHRISARIGAHVGANHQTGKLIVEMARKCGLEVIEKAPLRKVWSGSNGKITHKELALITGITGRTNQEERDAALLAWDYAGLPMIKTI